MDKKVKQRIMIIAVFIIVILTVMAIGFHIYNMPENRLARALDLGQKYLLEEDYEQAIVEFDKVIEIEPMNVDAYLGKAEAYIGLDDMETAMAVLEEGYSLTENEEIQRKLDELRSSIVETESIKMEENMVEEDARQEDGEPPYYELGFSPEDFTLAEYSVIDGDHLEDILEIVAEAMPNWDDVWEDDNYTGFSYVYSNYVDSGAFISYGSGGTSTIIYESGVISGSVLLKINGNDNIVDTPFLKGKVTPGVTSYEDALDILAIREIVQQTNEQERFDYYEVSRFGEYGFYIATFSFESQYGNTNCRCVYSEEGSIMFCRISAEEWDLVLSIWDNILDAIVIGFGFQE